MSSITVDPTSPSLSLLSVFPRCTRLTPPTVSFLASRLLLVEVRAPDSLSSTTTNPLLRSSSLNTVLLEYVLGCWIVCNGCRLDLPKLSKEAENKRRRERTEPRSLRAQRRPVRDKLPKPHLYLTWFTQCNKSTLSMGLLFFGSVCWVEVFAVPPAGSLSHSFVPEESLLTLQPNHLLIQTQLLFCLVGLAQVSTVLTLQNDFLPDPHNLAKYSALYLNNLSIDTAEIIPPMHSLFRPYEALELVESIALELDKNKHKEWVFHIFSSNG